MNMNSTRTEKDSIGYMEVPKEAYYGVQSQRAMENFPITGTKMNPDFIINMAKKYPDINFIGIVMFDSVIVRAVEKLESEEINNLKLIKFDATNIEDIFQNEISTIYLNFSDPWPKNRHEKRRLTSDRFLNKYEKIFKEKCHIIQKTDNRKLFEFSLMSYVNYGYKIKEISLDLNKDEKENVQTEYEEKFTNLGYPIYMVEVDKNLHKN